MPNIIQGDDLGDHVATKTLNMIANNISNFGFIEQDGTVPTTGAVRLTNDAEIVWGQNGTRLSYDSAFATFVFENDSAVTNAGSIQIRDTNPTPTALNFIGELNWYAENSVSAFHQYGSILMSSRVVTDALEDGWLRIQVSEGGDASQVYVDMNGTAYDGQIGLLKPVVFEDFLELKKITAPANPPTEDGRLYLKQVDADNNGLFIKIKLNGSIQEVRMV